MGIFLIVWRIFMDINLPENWQYFNFEKCINRVSVSSSLKIAKRDYQDKGEIPIIDQGKEFIAGYCSEKREVFDNIPVIIFGDHTCIFKYVDFPFLLGADGTKIISPKTELLVPKYFYYYLRSLKLENQGYSRHYKFLKEKYIIIPPINIQEKIIEKLENVEKLINYRNESLNLSILFLENLFVEYFGDLRLNEKGWECSELKDVSTIIMGQSPPGDSYNEEGIGKEFFQGKAEFGDVYPTVKKWTTEPKRIAKCGDILFSVRAPVGSVNIANIECSIGRGLAAIEPGDRLNNLYLFYYFKIMEKIIESRGTGSTFQSINKSQLSSLEVPMPPIELQNQFAEIVQQVEEIKKYQQESKAELENLLNNLMQKTFKGELIC